MRRVMIGLGSLMFAVPALAASTDKPPAVPQAYCINWDADFYPYTGDTCKSGYQLGAGNCRQTDGRLAAVLKSACLAAGGRIEIPHPPVADRSGKTTVPITRDDVERAAKPVVPK